MKKLFTVLLILAAMLILGACGRQAATSQTTDTVPVVLNQQEYILYENVGYNDLGPQIDKTKVTKQGVFATVWDAFSNKRRYYVWGYMDNTKCCDWQWEFVPEDLDSLPPVGSLVSVTGTFRMDDTEESLDGYWIVDASVKTESTYTGPTSEINMYTMSCTLERVQMLNILYVPASFEGKAFCAYGRIAAVNKLEDPYYDGSWQMPFASDASSPAIGTMVKLTGKVASGMLSECLLEIVE